MTMAPKRRAQPTRVKTLHRRKLDASRADKVRGGYIGETEKSKGASSRYGCDGSSKDPA